jgi:tetratricopeptide (TPR) repeat protein
MKASSIEELAYQIKQAREENLPKPIVFLGAGASKTGGIPLAGEIIKDIQTRYGNNPKVKMLKPEEHTYPKLMECLTPNERNKLLKSYIDRAKINVTHIYLAQLLNKGFIDYVLTVNFDNLMLRAMALYNDFPPTYDMAILKDLTTTNFKEKSVLYLHGQHHGLWLLNTEEEMNKVSGIIPPILNKIANERPWIFIGYSGEDPIFDHIVRLGRFDNGLYWITYYDNKPSDDVCRNLLEKENTNAYLIKGYDADSFMLKLNQELGLHQPQILDKPFTSLKTSIENFVDIDDKDHFKGVKERLEIVKREVQRAIDQFEEGKIETAEVLKKEADISLLKKQIIDEILKGEYNDNFIHRLDAEVNQTDSTELSNLMAELYLGWGNKYYNNNRDGVDTVPFELSIEKYRRSAEWNPGYDLAYCNWGLALSAIGRIHKTDSSFYKQAIEKFSKAIELVSDNNFAYSNWGRSLFSIAKIEQDEAIYRESFEKFQKAVELKATDDYSYSLWGEALSNLAKLKTDETLYRECFEKFQKAAELNPGDPFTYSNWAIAVHNLAKQIDDEALYNQSFELYQKVMDLTPSDFITMSNYALAIHDLALLKKDPELYRQSFEKYAKAIELNAEDSLTYLNWGVACHDLANLQENESLYLESIQKYQKAAEIVKDWDLAYSNWGLALDQLAKLTKNESYYLQSIAQHQQAYDLNPGNLFYSKKLGAALLEFGKFKQNRELIERSVPFLKKAAENNGGAYDLACAYALLNDEENALPLLDTLLQQKAITVEYVEQDADWKSYSDNNQFKAILNRHRA